MLTLSVIALACIGTGLVAAGALAAGLVLSLRSRREHVSIADHRTELIAQRRRFRHRLRAVRDELARARSTEQALQREVRVAADHHVTQERLLAGARAENENLRERVQSLEQTDSSRAPELLRLKAREQAQREQLRSAQERIATFEHERGLLRIERDELEAHTHRLRAFGTPPAAANESGNGETSRASRTELADRDARIHELQCQLQQRSSQVEELETDLRTWKYRIAPLALHMKLRRMRDDGATAERPSLRSNDDLKRIRGISRSLEKKLRAAGVTEYAQLAGMSPAELANLAVRVGAAASRPQRDQWAEQAQELCAARAVETATGESQAETA